jgi:effector-binding domain-containing protein
MRKIIQFTAIILTVTFSLTSQKSNAMEKKSVEKTTVLMCSLQSSLASMMQDVGDIPNELMAKAKELGLEITGPQLWQYTGSDGQPNTKFTLDICIPVKAAKGDPGKFKFVTLPEFKCISEIHKGPWNLLGNTYQRLMGEISRKSIPFTGISREIYMVCDFEKPENCVTEVQIEIQ